MQLNDIHAIQRHYDHVYVSPHFDDVAISCGGRILNQKQAGESVLVVTVFSARANQYTRISNKALQTMLDYDRRRLEDTEAMKRLSVDFLWLEFPEILFRLQSPWRRYWLTYPDTAANKRLCRQVTVRLSEICRQTQCTEIVLPLGIGQHVDHQIVFQAGLTLQHHQPHPNTASFYEELPYTLFPFLLIYRLKRTGIWHALTQQTSKHIIGNQHVSSKMLTYLLGNLPSLGIDRKFLQPGLLFMMMGVGVLARYVIQPRGVDFEDCPAIEEVEDISTHIDQKLDAISAYASQLSSPLLTRQNIKKSLATYATTLALPEGRYGERYWQMK